MECGGRMTAKENHVAQIFDRTKRIIDQARQQCHLWEYHLFPKLILNGITPPPWLCNSPSKELNKDVPVSDVLFSQPQFTVPFSGRHCSLYNNLGVVSDDVQYPIGLHDEVHASKKDCNAGDRILNLPECSVNNDGCASSGPSELDFGAAISPQNQIEPRVSDSYHDPSLLSLAKLQRSKQRQKALQLRSSAKGKKGQSGSDNNGSWRRSVKDDETFTGSASTTVQEVHKVESELVKDFNSNIQSCSMEEEMRIGDRVTQNCDKSNHFVRITRSKTLAPKLNPSNVASSTAVKEVGPPFNNLSEPLKPLSRLLFTSESCEVKEANKGEYKGKEDGCSAYRKGSTKSRGSIQERYNSELLKLDTTLGRVKGVEVHDFIRSFAQSELTDLSNASDHNNGSRRNSVKDGDFCNKKQESNSHDQIGLLRSSCPSPGDDNLTTDGSVKSIRKSVQSPEPLIPQHSQDPAVSVVGSFRSEKDPDFCSAKAKDCSSKSDSGAVYITRDSRSQNHCKEISKSFSSNLCGQGAACSGYVTEKSQNVPLIELYARRLSSRKKDSKLDAEVTMNFSEQENIAPIEVSRNSRAVTMCPTEASMKPVSSSNLDGGSLPGKSLYFETAVTDKVLYAQENLLSGANPIDNIDRTATTVSKAVADSVEKGHSCLGSRFTSVSPDVGADVSIMRLPSDFVMSVIPKQLAFDDAEGSSMNGISSPDLKEGQQCMPPEEPIILLEPVDLLENETSLVCQGNRNSLGEMNLMEMQEALTVEERRQIEHCASHLEEVDVAWKALNAVSPNKELAVVQKELAILTSNFVNHSSTLQVASENSPGSLSKEVMASKFVSLHSTLENGESGTKLADAFAAADSANCLHKYTDKFVTNLTVEFPSTALMDEVNVGRLSDGKNTGFKTDLQSFKSSIESFTYDVEHLWPQSKRRKTEIETEKIVPVSSSFVEKPLDSINQRCAGRNLSIEEKNQEAVLEVQHLTSNEDDDTGLQYVSNCRTEEVQDTKECQTMEGFPLKVRKEEKHIMDGRDISVDNLLLPDTNMPRLSVDSTMRCTMDGKVASCHQVNCVQECVAHVSGLERSTSSRRICPGGNAKLSGGSYVSPGIQCLDLMGSDDTVPEFEGFIMQTDNVQPCTAGDQLELEKMSLLSNSIDYTSLCKSMFMHSPLCYSATPYKLHNIPDLYQSLSNGLLEGMGLRTSLPLNDGRADSLSDPLSNCKGTDTPSVQTIWDRINSNFSSSGKRQSLKLELPCINEENENMDENSDTFKNGIGSEGMARSITREPPAEIVDNDPSTSVLQNDMPTDGHIEFVSTEFNVSGTHKKVKKKLDKQDDNGKRFTIKGRENQCTSLGKNGAKRTTESLYNRSSRPKLSGKDSMKRPGPTYSESKSKPNNIVCGITSFIPLVQKKQEAAVITGKRDINVKALQTGEVAKRMLEKKENDRKMRREALMRERLQKKKEEEERKKVAEMAAKKRQREEEEEEKKDKERKKKRVNDVKKQQQGHGKTHSKKEHIEIQSRTTGEKEGNKLMDERGNHKNLQLEDHREDSVEKISENEPSIFRDSTNNKAKESCPEYSEAVNNCADNGKVMVNLTKATEDGDLFIKNSIQEQSYEISPYKGSDDEFEDEDDVPNQKYIPWWASKQHLFQVVSSQKMDPEIIFPPHSFRNIVEVLPRKLQL
ncbi:PREDICTED: uncharacterized protein LOC109346321 isoform X1 [Lupinus angustifolius]|uniref:uncharacterized protein LOC109346321 isoform X1 n=1 Tax=Lupinus angustifolius TaxID=3871 RepID=UPI00092E3459|nr:PREDICTED: uncharacterized protein LOC109346321 isoform X1 [Lupinus angustifolius]